MIDFESTVTDRFQTTVPLAVRRALRLRKRDRIRFSIGSDGAVILTRVDATDPALAAFLSFLASDLKTHPERVRTLETMMVDRIHALTGVMEIDLNERLGDDCE